MHSESMLRRIRGVLVAAGLVVLGGIMTERCEGRSLAELEALTARAKSLDAFLSNPKLVAAYYEALRNYQGRDHFKCDSYETILRKVTALGAAVPGFKERLWEKRAGETLEFRTLIPASDSVTGTSSIADFKFRPVPRAFHAIFSDPSPDKCLSDHCEKNDATVPERWAAALAGSRLYFVEKNGIFNDLSLLVTPVTKGKDTFALVTLGGGPQLKREMLILDPRTKAFRPGTLLDRWLWRAVQDRTRSFRAYVARVAPRTGTAPGESKLAKLTAQAETVGQAWEFSFADGVAEKIARVAPRSCSAKGTSPFALLGFSAKPGEELRWLSGSLQKLFLMDPKNPGDVSETLSLLPPRVVSGLSLGDREIIGDKLSALLQNRQLAAADRARAGLLLLQSGVPKNFTPLFVEASKSDVPALSGVGALGMLRNGIYDPSAIDTLARAIRPANFYASGLPGRFLRGALSTLGGPAAEAPNAARAIAGALPALPKLSREGGDDDARPDSRGGDWFPPPLNPPGRPGGATPERPNPDRPTPTTRESQVAALLARALKNSDKPGELIDDIDRLWEKDPTSRDFISDFTQIYNDQKRTCAAPARRREANRWQRWLKTVAEFSLCPDARADEGHARRELSSTEEPSVPDAKGRAQNDEPVAYACDRGQPTKPIVNAAGKAGPETGIVYRAWVVFDEKTENYRPAGRDDEAAVCERVLTAATPDGKIEFKYKVCEGSFVRADMLPGFAGENEMLTLQNFAQGARYHDFPAGWISSGCFTLKDSKNFAIKTGEQCDRHVPLEQVLGKAPKPAKARDKEAQKESGKDLAEKKNESPKPELAKQAPEPPPAKIPAPRSVNPKFATTDDEDLENQITIIGNLAKKLQQCSSCQDYYLENQRDLDELLAERAARKL